MRVRQKLELEQTIAVTSWYVAGESYSDSSKPDAEENLKLSHPIAACKIQKLEVTITGYSSRKLSGFNLVATR